MTEAATEVWISMTQLRRHIHRVMRDVERGRTFVVTHRGRPVARIVAAAGAGAT